MIESLIENVLNRGLPRSIRAQQLCRELEAQRVAIDVSGFGRLVVESTGVSLKVSRDATGTAGATITGGLVSLMALAGARPEEVLQRGDVQISGDVELAERFRELAMLLRPDLEEELSTLVGDVPAHQVGRFARAAMDWTRRAAKTTTRNAAEYFAHEKRDLIPRAEGDQFLKGVDALREDVDRLEARIDHLGSRGSA